MNNTFRKTKIFTFLMLLSSMVYLSFAEPSKEGSLSAYNDVDAANSYEELSFLVDTSDPKRARFILLKLDFIKNQEPQVEALLKDLWSSGHRAQSLKNQSTYQHPIARLKLAEVLSSLDNQPQYAEYILSLKDHPDWQVKLGVAEALSSFRSDMSLEVLSELVRSDYLFVASAAARSLKTFLIDFEYSNKAKSILLEVRRSTKKNRLIDEIDQALSMTGHQQHSSAGETSKTDVNALLKRQDYADAIQVVLPEARKGDPQKQSLVGNLFLALETPDYAQALYWIREAANQNYAPATARLGLMYLDGKGVERDIDRAIELLESAKALGYEPAEKHLEIIKRRKH